jgi:hypothetical protein
MVARKKPNCELVASDYSYCQKVIKMYKISFKYVLTCWQVITRREKCGLFLLTGAFFAVGHAHQRQAILGEKLRSAGKICDGQY